MRTLFITTTALLLSTAAHALSKANSIATQPAAVPELTKAELLEGLKIPEYRKYPLSKTVSPCENFYEYVCGEVKANFTMPADRSVWKFGPTDGSEKILHARKKYFEKLAGGYTPKSARARQVKDYYLSCMDTAGRKQDELDHITKEKGIVMGLKNKEDLMRLLEARNVDIETSFVGYTPIPNQQDPLTQDISIGASFMSFPEKSYYQKDEVVADFQKMLTIFFEEIGVDRPAERAAWVIEIEKEFAADYPKPAEVRQRFTKDTYISRAEVLKKYPNLRAANIFALIPAHTKIRDPFPEALSFANKVVDDEENFEKLRSMLLYYSLRGIIEESHPRFFQARYDFNSKHFGAPAQRPPLQERCTNATAKTFDMEIDEALQPILFPNFPKEKVTAIAEKVRAKLLESIQANTWLSEGAKAEAIRKMQTARMMLVSPERKQDWDFMPVRKYDPRRLITNMKAVGWLQHEKTIKELGEKRNPNRWSQPPLMFNAYYNPMDNTFVLMQGILQYPYFDGRMSEVENMGAIGSTVGHELGHGIDDAGSKFDSTGKLRAWMTERDLAEFKKRTARFVDRFDKIGHDGRLTLGENIGDHVGLVSALAATFPDLDKADVKSLRKFFVAFARQECYVASPAVEQNQLKTDPHSLGWARVNEQVIHTEGFHRAYGCKAGDKMYLAPEERIHVW